MQKKEKHIESSKWIVLGSMVITLAFFLGQLCIFSINRENSVLSNIQTVTYNKQENLLNFSSQIQLLNITENRLFLLLPEPVLLPFRLSFL